jgi:hypothetical protein
MMKVGRILIAVGLLAAAALAQGPPELYAPPAPGAPALPAATPWAAIAISLVGAVGICIAGFKSSHRTHLD